MLDASSPGGSATSWRTLGSVTPSDLLETRLTLHHAAQLLASFGQALIAPREDDSHRGMTWNAAAQAFRTDDTEDGLHARLVVPSFELEILRGEAEVAARELRGLSRSQALSWLAEELGSLPERDFVQLKWPEYDLPEQPGGQDSPFEPEAKALRELAAWYDDASRVLERLFGDLPEASSVRGWPHHFDVGSLLTYRADGGGGDARHVGIGLSPGDEGRPEPYYYVNGWPAPPASDLPALEGPGSWNTEGWVGAVLDASTIVLSGSGEEQERTVRTFLATAVGTMRATVLAAP